MSHRSLSHTDGKNAGAELPRVSVVVPIRNEAAHIEDTLQQLLDQDLSGLEMEILVADGRSTDRTREIVTRLAAENNAIQLFDNPDKLSSAARNIGVQNSTGDFVLVIDGHCEIPTKTYLVDLVDAFERTGADCLGRPQPLDVTGASLFQQAVAAARNSPLGHHPDSFIYSNEELKVPAVSVGVAYRREVFDQVGLFDPSFDACEDGDLNHRIDLAGLTCFLIPRLAIRYQPRNSLRGLFTQMSRYGRGRVRLARKHPGCRSLSSMIPALFLLGLIMGPVVCWFVPFLWYVYWGILALYAAIVLGFSLSEAIRCGNPATLIWLPAVFITVHVASGWGFVRELLIPSVKNVGESGKQVAEPA